MYIPVKDTWKLRDTRKSKDPSSNCLHGKNGSLSKPDIYGQEPHISFRQVIYYVDRWLDLTKP